MDERIKKADDLMRQGKSSLAVSIIKDVLKEMPEEPYLHYLLGIARMKCVRFFLAKRALEKADQLMPNHAENLRSLGWVKVMLGKVEEGRNDLRKAISLDLMNHLSYIDLAMSYFHYFDFKEGKEWLERGRALAPKDPYVLTNIKTAKEMEREYSKYSASELQEMRKEKLTSEYQRFFRISMLQKYYTGKPLTRDEAEEVQEEAQLNGAPASITRAERRVKMNERSSTITEKQEKEFVRPRSKSKSLKMEEILKKRKEIEKEISQMLKEINSPFNVEHIKDIIYHEEDSDDLMKIVSVFDRGGSTEELNKILEIVNDAWNYFPHKSLNGLCPMEKILEYQEK